MFIDQECVEYMIILSNCKIYNNNEANISHEGEARDAVKARSSILYSQKEGGKVKVGFFSLGYFTSVERAHSVP